MEAAARVFWNIKETFQRTSAYAALYPVIGCLMADEHIRFPAFGPSVPYVTEQDVPCFYGHWENQCLTGFLLDDADTFLFPVNIVKTYSSYVRSTEPH